MGQWVLPLFGGGPSVWTTCLFFFQVVLLGGYAYADALVRRWSVSKQRRVHLSVLWTGLSFGTGFALWSGAPFSPPEALSNIDDATVGVLVALTTTCGPLFFALTASAPLFQSWSAALFPGRPAYRLYALSNAGSLISLLTYPFLIEPLMGRTQQGWMLLIAFGGFTVLTTLATRSLRSHDKAPVEATSERVPLSRFVGWATVSALGNAVLAATSHRLSEDVAGGPLQWLLPLALYLSTFIVCFERPKVAALAPWVFVFGIACCLTGMSWVGAWDALAVTAPLSAVTLVSACMVCHGTLFRHRPAEASASRFYLAIAAGGALGGLFTAAIAPRMFSSVAEYPVALIGCCFVSVFELGTQRPAVRWSALAALAVAAISVAVAWDGGRRHGRRVFQGRNFYGVLSVESFGTPGAIDFEFSMNHGRIAHGWQYKTPPRLRELSGYFSLNSGVGRSVEALRTLQARGLSIAVLGLGVGQLANFGTEKDSMQFFEVNPLVISLAQGAGGYFSALSQCPARTEVIAGDARRSLDVRPPQRYDLLVVDVFTGDSIPSHLLTWEAFELYRRHLLPSGVMAIHITNRYLDLEPVLVSHAQRLGWQLVMTRSVDTSGALSVWGVLSANERTFQTRAFASPEVSNSAQAPLEWTDEQHSILPLLTRRLAARDVR
jgi:hypothetical protein